MSRGYHMNRHTRRYGANASNVSNRKSSHREPEKGEDSSGLSSSSYLADDENYPSFKAQLAKLSLELRDIPADGNCLFRALGDQLDGHSENHHHLRQSICDYIVEHRSDFEPFIEDDIPFSTHLRNLRQLGTYGGNEVIVAFCRLYHVNVVIHQLGRDPWQICGTEEARIGANSGRRRQLHISYHNGDHYSSVRRLGDTKDGPSSIRIPFDLQNAHNSQPSAGPEAVGRLLHRLEERVDSREVARALEEADWDEDAAAAYLLQLEETERNNSNTAGGLWAPGGTGTRLFGGYGGYGGKTTPRAGNRRLTKLAKKERATERRRAERQSEEHAAIVQGVHAIQI